MKQGQHIKIVGRGDTQYLILRSAYNPCEDGRIALTVLDIADGITLQLLEDPSSIIPVKAINGF